jgi:hypothetical protein
VKRIFDCLLRARSHLDLLSYATVVRPDILHAVADCKVRMRGRLAVQKICDLEDLAGRTCLLHGMHHDRRDKLCSMAPTEDDCNHQDGGNLARDLEVH